MTRWSLVQDKSIFRSTMLCGLFILAACSASPEISSDRRPYIFTQQHNDKPFQQVRIGWPLQVQLPGNPAVWTFRASESLFVEPRGRTVLHSPGRIDGTESLFVFDFALSENAAVGNTGKIVITTDLLPESLSRIIPDGNYSIHYEIVP